MTVADTIVVKDVSIVTVADTIVVKDAPIVTLPYSRNPWLSVSDMLVANKCWLCMTPFQRGYKKKVFMVSQLIVSLMQRKIEHIAATEAGELLAEIESENFRACYKAFVYDLNGDELNLAEELKKYDVPEWTSGLACCRSANCSEEYELLVPPKETADGVTTGMKPRVVRKHKLMSDPNCPPNCGCDNPWPFLSV